MIWVSRVFARMRLSTGAGQAPPPTVRKRSDMVEETSKKKSEIGFAAGELNLVLVRRKWRWSIRSSR
ncbi:unnamed protein product [Sphagnum jensenii]|uniref:Uncharacterized protein n=1 Tax=Sphagnum jensenii TaxID=128206 RepID=A0ABP0W7A0_9BRYO